MIAEKFEIATQLYKKIKQTQDDLESIEDVRINPENREFTLNTNRGRFSIPCEHALFYKFIDLIEEELKNSLLLLNQQFEAL